MEDRKVIQAALMDRKWLCLATKVRWDQRQLPLPCFVGKFSMLYRVHTPAATPHTRQLSDTATPTVLQSAGSKINTQV